MAYVQKNNPVPKTGCGRRRVSAMENPFKSKTLESVSKGLKKASNTHAGQAKKIDKYLKSSPSKMTAEEAARAQGREPGEMNASSSQNPNGQGPKKGSSGMFMKSPMKGKLKPCQKSAARAKFDVYPSAYANMWASNHKC